MTRPGFKYIPKYKGYVRVGMPDKSLNAFEMFMLSKPFNYTHVEFDCAYCGKQIDENSWLPSRILYDKDKKFVMHICEECYDKEHETIVERLL